MFDLKFAALFRENKTSSSAAAAVFMQNLVANFILFFLASSASQNTFMLKSKTDEQNEQSAYERKKIPKRKMMLKTIWSMLFYSVINVHHQNATTKAASAANVRCGKNDAGKLRFKRTNQVPKYYLSKFQITATRTRVNGVRAGAESRRLNESNQMWYNHIVRKTWS